MLLLQGAAGSAAAAARDGEVSWETGLAIEPAPADGFHGLTTMYQTRALHDVMTVDAVPAVRAAESSIVLSSNHPWVPQGNRNTVWKMVERCRLC